MTTVARVSYYLIASIGGCLNVIGLVLLTKDRKIGGRQKALLSHLTCAVLFFVLMTTVNVVAQSFETKTARTLQSTLKKFEGVEFIPMFEVIMFLTLDQFLSCVLVYQYRALFNDKHLITLLTAMWVTP